MTSAYTAEEVRRHNHEKDLWMVMDGNVYDLTKFLKEHPGGEEVLIGLAGEDGTKCFNDIGHSEEAVGLRASFKIGELTEVGSRAGGTAGSKGVPPTTIDDDNWEYEPPKKETSPWLPATIAVGVLIYAFIFYNIWYS